VLLCDFLSVNPCAHDRPTDALPVRASCSGSVCERDTRRACTHTAPSPTSPFLFALKATSPFAPWRSEQVLTVVVVGGSDSGGALASGEALRFPGGSVVGHWYEWTDMPCARFYASAASLPSARTALLLGGEPAECSDTLKWSSAEASWVVPEGDSVAIDTVGGRAVSAVGGGGEEAVLLLGGRPTGTPTPTSDATVFRLETVDGNTTLVRDTALFGVAVAPMPTPRSEFGASWANGSSADGAVVMAAGGVVDDTGTPVATVDLLDVATGLWTVGPPLDVALKGLTVVEINGMFVAVGGETVDGDVVGTGWTLPTDVSAGWTPIANMTTPRAFHTAVAVSSGSDHARVCVAGGIGDAGVIMDSVECWNPATDAWVPAPSLSTPRAYATLVTFSV
jgi:hypothetical protein